MKVWKNCQKNSEYDLMDRAFCLRACCGKMVKSKEEWWFKIAKARRDVIETENGSSLPKIYKDLAKWARLKLPALSHWKDGDKT